MTTWPSTRGPLAVVALLGLGCSDRTLVAPERASHAAAYSLLSVNPSRHVILLRQERRATIRLFAAIAAAGGRVERSYDDIGAISVSGLSPAAVSGLTRQPEVEEIGRDVSVQWLPRPEQLGLAVRRVDAQGDPSGTPGYLLGFQWNLTQTQADDAWPVTPQGSGALVCILDTGIDPEHVELAGKVDLSKSASFVAAEPDIRDFHFHGTFVAGMVATNGVNISSVAPNARLCAVKVLDQTGSGSFDDIIAGIMFAASVGADVINMSFGAVLPTGDRDTRATFRAMERAVLYALRRGALLVAATGNEGLNLDSREYIVFPAELPGVVSVGATGPFNGTDFDRLASYSNYGTLVTLMAPGGEDALLTGNEFDGLVSACSQYSPVFGGSCAGGHDFYVFGGHGTSFAAPQVAAAAAVVESNLPGNQGAARLAYCLLVGAEHPDGLTPSPSYGFGRLNVLLSVQATGCTPSLTP